MRWWLLFVAALAVAVGCRSQTLDSGSNTGAPDGGSQDGSIASSSSSGGSNSSSGGGAHPNKCHGSGTSPDASTGGGPDAMGQPAVCTSNGDCSPSDVCVVELGAPGLYDGGASAGTCGPPCQSDCDCPAWLTCQGGVCTDCSNSSCGAGQTCAPLAFGGPNGGCGSGNTACPLGQYCYANFPTGCNSILVCVECQGGCPACASNRQCSSGQVCVGGKCQQCTADSQCGPSAKCQASHTAIQCTCSADTDCASGDTCQSGICGPGNTGCGTGPRPSCPNGQACINGACGPCSSFEDCNNTSSPGVGLPGLACVNGACTACSSNSQCGGGQACVGGTCGACVTNAQCGQNGQCRFGYCTCTSDAQCSAGQRCGWGVCVEM
jgi:hypothetical protein